MKSLITIGEIRGSFAAEIAKSAIKGKFGQTEAATLLSASYLDAIQDTEKVILRSSFEANNPVILVRPSYQEIRNLVKILGIEDAISFPEDAIGTVDAYAVDKEDGTIWQSTFMSTSVGQKDLTISHTDDNGVTMVNKMSLGTYVMAETDYLGVEKVLNWINESGKRNNSEFAGSSLKQAKSKLVNNTNQLTDLAQAFVDQVYYTLRDNKGNIANYTVSSFAYSCYSIDNGNNWFYVQQFGVFSPGNVYTVDNDQQQYWYTDLYEQNSWPTNFKDSRTVNLIISSPQTTINTATATSSVSYSISGTVGFSDKGGSGSITGGMSISNSTTVQIPDLTINNRSLTSTNNAQWQFVIPRSHGVDDGCVNSLSTVVGISHNTFQPMNQWLWRVDDSARNSGALSVSNTFVTRWINSYMGDCNIFGCNCDVNAQEWRPDMGVHYFSIPFPPKN